nr:protein air2 [Quercus suber]
MEESRTAAVGRKRKQPLDFIDRPKRLRREESDADVHGIYSDAHSGVVSVGYDHPVLNKADRSNDIVRSLSDVGSAAQNDGVESRQPRTPHVRMPLPSAGVRRRADVQSMTLQDVRPEAFQARVSQLIPKKGGSVYDVVSGICAGGIEFKTVSSQCLRSFHMKIARTADNHAISAAAPTDRTGFQSTRSASATSEPVSVGNSPVRDRRSRLDEPRVGDKGDRWICIHCGRADHHASWSCPTWRKCARCRERGHPSRDCRKHSVDAGRDGDVCDVCGKPGHVEEECPGLYRTFYPDQAKIRKKPREDVVIYCHVCGRKEHAAGDCPTLPLWARASESNWMPWSAAYARKFISGMEGDIDNAKKSGSRDYQANLLDELLA